MKLIEALKGIKDLQRKADDLVTLVAENCAISTLVSPKYGLDQQSTIDGWIQSHKDLLKEIARLRLAIQRTNLVTDVTIELNGIAVTKPISYWIQRRQELAGLELKMWNHLTDRGIKEGEYVQRGSSDDPIKVNIIRYFSPAKKDKMRDALQSEPHIIDSKLEIVNAITDLVEE